MNNGSLIKINHAGIYVGTKTKTKEKILEAVNMTLGAGEVIGLIGANGCGKTTLMKAICGIKQIDSGTIEVNIEEKTKFGLLSTEGGIYRDVKVRSQLNNALGLSTDKGREIYEFVTELLELGPLMDKFGKELSFGQKQKLRLARVMIINPKILLLDEPTTGLDIKAKKRVGECIKYMKSLGRTIVFASHDLSEIRGVCDYVHIVKNNLVSQRMDSDFLGDPNEVMELI
jgi:ABC-type multidrug transport system ATPase subunit